MVLRNFLDISYLKLIDFSKLFVAEKNYSKNLALPLSEHFWDTQYKNIFSLFASIKEIFLKFLFRK